MTTRRKWAWGMVAAVMLAVAFLCVLSASFVEADANSVTLNFVRYENVDGELGAVFELRNNSSQSIFLDHGDPDKMPYLFVAPNQPPMRMRWPVDNALPMDREIRPSDAAILRVLVPIGYEPRGNKSWKVTLAAIKTPKRGLTYVFSARVQLLFPKWMQQPMGMFVISSSYGKTPGTNTVNSAASEKANATR